MLLGVGMMMIIGVLACAIKKGNVHEKKARRYAYARSMIAHLEDATLIYLLVMCDKVLEDIHFDRKLLPDSFDAISNGGPSVHKRLRIEMPERMALVWVLACLSSFTVRSCVQWPLLSTVVNA